MIKNKTYIDGETTSDVTFHKIAFRAGDCTFVDVYVNIHERTEDKEFKGLYKNVDFDFSMYNPPMIAELKSSNINLFVEILKDLSVKSKQTYVLGKEGIPTKYVKDGDIFEL